MGSSQHLASHTMIKTHNTLTYTASLLTAFALLLVLPSWLAFTLVLIGATLWAIHNLQLSAAQLKVIGQFVVEFLGFSALVLLFVLTFVLMNGLLLA